WGDSNLTGLLLLQNTGIRFTLEVQTGTITTVNDMFSATTGTVTDSAITCKPQLELYHLPADPKDDPDLAFVKTTIEDQQSITSTGDFVYRPILGNIYTSFLQEFVNNAAPLDITKVNSIKLSYAQSQVVYNMSPDMMLARQRRLYDRD